LSRRSNCQLLPRARRAAARGVDAGPSRRVYRVARARSLRQAAEGRHSASPSPRPGNAAAEPRTPRRRSAPARSGERPG